MPAQRADRATAKVAAGLAPRGSVEPLPLTPSAPAPLIVKGEKGDTGADSTVPGPPGATFNGGTVTTGITAPSYVLSGTPTTALKKQITKTVNPGAAPAGTTYYDLFQFNMAASLQGFYTISLSVRGSGYGQSMLFVLPVTYAMDWLHNGGYGYTSGTNPFAGSAWVTLTPVVFTGRHLMGGATTMNLQAKVFNNAIYFRLWLSAALTGSPFFDLVIQHSEDFALTTITEYSTTGTAAGPFSTLPNLASSKGGTTAFWNPVGIKTNAPAYALDVNDQAIFRGNVGFHGATPNGKPTITGSRGGNAALAALLTALATKGLLTDGTTT